MKPTKEELRKAAEKIMHPIVTESDGKRITMGFWPEEWNVFSTPDNTPIHVVVEEIGACGCSED